MDWDQYQTASSEQLNHPAHDNTGLENCCAGANITDTALIEESVRSSLTRCLLTCHMDFRLRPGSPAIGAASDGAIWVQCRSIYACCFARMCSIPTTTSIRRRNIKGSPGALAGHFRLAQLCHVKATTTRARMVHSCWHAAAPGGDRMFEQQKKDVLCAFSSVGLGGRCHTYATAIVTKLL